METKNESLKERATPSQDSLTDFRDSARGEKKPAIEAMSILIFATGISITLMLITFHPNDPSAFTLVGTNPPTPIPIHNAFGRLGAEWSAFCLQLLGIGSILIPILLIYGAVALYQERKLRGLLPLFTTLFVGILSLTALASIHFNKWTYSGSRLLVGGAVGTWIAEILTGELNTTGATIFLTTLILLALTLATPFSVILLGRRGLKWARGFLLRTKGFQFPKLLPKRGQKAIVRNSGLKETVAAAKSEMPGEGQAEITGEFQVEGERHRQEHGEIHAQDSSEDHHHEPHFGLPEATTSTLEDPLKLLGEALLPKAATPGSLNEALLVSLSPSEGPKVLLPEAPKKSAETKRTPAKRFSAMNWELPPLEFLKKPPEQASEFNREHLVANSHILKQKFADFGIDGEVTAVRPGPVITLYEFKPGPGVKVSRIAALADDLSMALSAQSVRILAPLPGKAVVGIEIPSDHREIVFLREFLQHPDFFGQKYQIPVVMGKDISGQPYLSDLSKMPHLLCAGQTGSGKSVFMNGLICSLFYRFSPDELRMILVDPKFIEFRAYQDIPHLLLPVVDDPKNAATALRWAVREMERRYRILAKLGVRNLASYNQKVQDLGSDAVSDLLFAEDETSSFDTGPAASSASPISEKDWIEAFEPDEAGQPKISKLPTIVIIIDELADLMMIAKKEVEISIARIAQKARAAGIHLIIATQRPSTDVVTGLIKANLPSRVSFQLASYVDSKTILDRAGAERLLGQGDMLFIPPGISQSIRLHGAYLDDDEINKIARFLKSQGKPSYRNEILFTDEEGEDEAEDGERDALYAEAKTVIQQSGHASASYLQRQFKIGYNRASRIIEEMEHEGLIGPQEGSKPREIFMRE